MIGIKRIARARGLALLAVALALGGCGVMQERTARREALADPKLTPEIRAAIEGKQIRVGMTKQQVIAAWGNPCWWCYGTRTTSRGDSWEYNLFGSSAYGIGNGTYLYFDTAGRLTYWSR